ncbi:filamentous hemagglutinin family protein [Bradyrhizobium manausense]|uniref:filamentous haemagglutinin family protein n=1 Tax=Bradyrhizobium manausense TaxID=989370 RepID=UPI001BA60458|nr:filamentous haemagglutinin family protein [Bradyrhizobium manausense]MBR1089231.1 filamentous hemagglutinin family protein [Bradyrhizobium manausense]
MAANGTLVPHDRSHRFRQQMLLGSVSVVALLASGAVAEARDLNSVGAPSAVAATQAAQQAAAIQASMAGLQAQRSLTQGALALRAQLTAQAAAAAAAQKAPSSIPDGIAVGGLNPANYTGYAVNDPAKKDPTLLDPTLWQNASAPVVSSKNGRTYVDITQNQQHAILNWQTFNVGRNTTLDFNGQASNWTVLNRVTDPSLAPSQVLGQIKANGGVYIINANGIIFGGSSQINIGSLVASDLDLGTRGSPRKNRDDFFNSIGIANTTTQSFSTTLPEDAVPTGIGVRVDAGATIATNPNPTPGFVYLFGVNVANHGSIIAPGNEVALVSGQEITATKGSYISGTIPKSVLTDAGFRGTGFQIQQYASTYVLGKPSGPFRPGTGQVSNDGLIVAPQAAVVMMGDRISMDALHDAAGNVVLDPTTGNRVGGVIYAPTSISRNSMVLMDAATSVTMNGTIYIPPYENGETLSGGSSGSSVQNFTPAFVEMSGQLSVTLGPGALVSAPSAVVSLNAFASNPAYAGRPDDTISASLSGSPSIVMSGAGTVDGIAEPGATIDVAGLQDVQLPASYNFISIQPRGIDFADEPLQRSGVLYGKTLWIDIRATGKNSNGTTWCGTPVANACGYTDTVSRSIDQLMTKGGSVSFKTDLTSAAPTAVTLQSGSVVNVAGGYEEFLAGLVPTTVLIGSDGRRYDIAKASPDLTYIGIAGQFTVNHPHWGVTETWTTFQTHSVQAGYLQGSDAGSISFSTIDPEFQAARLIFGSVTGALQAGAGTAPSQGTLSITTPASVVVTGPGGNTSSANFTSTSPLSPMTLSADQLSSYGLSGLSITANDLFVTSDSTLNLAAGGSFSAVVPGAIDIAGTVSAAGGNISLVTDRFGFTSGAGKFGKWLSTPRTASGKADIFVEGTLDASGRWVNDSGQLDSGVVGPGFINGGSISIATNNSSDNRGAIVDTTGSIVLAAASLLDVSSGGYISPQGKAQTASPGVMAGSAGSISLELYQGASWGGPDPTTSVGGLTNPNSGAISVLQLNGSLRAYGFQSNGILKIAAPQAIQIGGQPDSNGQPTGGGLFLPASFFNNGGFGAYVIESASSGRAGVTDSIAIAAGTSMRLEQQNLSSVASYVSVPTGTKIASGANGSGFAPLFPLETLADDLRTPVNLTLASNNITLGAGASIVTDARASVTFYGTPNVSSSSGVDTTTQTTAQSVLLLGQIVDHGGTVSVYSRQTWLGPNSLIDLSGTVIANSSFGNNGVSSGVSAALLAGGTFTVEALPQESIGAGSSTAPTGYLVAQQGAVVDVSGISATIQAKDATGRGASPVSMWSDAGTVSVDVGAFVWGGTFTAVGGRSPVTGQANPSANGGTLMLGGSNVTLQQGSANVTTALASLAAPASAGDLTSLAALGSGQLAPFTNQIVATVDRLGAFDNVFLYSGYSAGGPGHIFTDLTDKTFGFNAPTFRNLTISGALDWNVANRLHIAASSISLDGNTPGSSTVLSAPYVMLTGGGGTSTAATNPASSLVVDAMNIDVEGAAFSNFAQITLGGSPNPGSANRYTTADIRLSTPKVSNGISKATTAGEVLVYPSTFSGSLAASGNLTLSAERIYPVSAVNFTIQAPGTVTFTAPAGSAPQTPLSAGGSVNVVAPNIVQDGNLFAPLGTITLGGSGTQQVTLGAGSLTSVSLDNTIVPYGTTQDGINWYYNNALAPLAQLPGKAVTLSGTNVSVGVGSTTNLSGGGDVVAGEFVAGTGGSRDTLATVSGQPTVYALLPSRNDPVAALDINFTAAQSASQAGDPYPLAGTQITISGGGGIPAGTYTLYPGHYAILPGALRVVDYGSNLGRNIASGTTLQDGTVLVAGNYTQSTNTAKRSAGSELFAIQTGTVWRQYSEYTVTSGNSYFPKHSSTTTPSPLPIDAGRLAVVAQQQILLSGTVATQPGTDSSGNVGRGGQLDVSGSQVAVVNGAGNAPAGYVGLDVNELNAFNFESILIGGQRTDQANGTTTITPAASSVVIDTGGVAFTAPEILLVAGATPPQTQTINQSLSIAGGTFTTNFQVSTTSGGQVVVKSGSVIDTVSGVQSTYGRNYVYANPASATATSARAIATALGGTLDSTGTHITGANVFSFFTGQGVPLTNVSLPLYSGGLGAVFMATSNPKNTITGPTGTSTPTLTIDFADIGPGTPVIGSLTLPAGNTSNVTIEAGTRVSTTTLSLQASGPTNAIALNRPVNGAAAAVIQAKQLNLTAQSIGLGNGATGALALSADTLQTTLASVQGLSLKAYNGNITFTSGVAFAPKLQNLTLDAPALLGSGSDVNIGTGASVTLVNTSAVAAPTNVPTTGGALTIEAAEIDLGGGAQTIGGFSQVNWSASKQILLAGSGAMTLGSSGAVPVNLSITTPDLLVGSATASGTGSQFILTTLGNVGIARPAGASADPGASSQIGGNFVLKAASIDVSGTIQAQAGTLGLEATSGDVRLDNGAWIAAGGYAKTLIDATQYVAGGKVSLQADLGNVVTMAGSTIDVSQPAGGQGYGGVINVTATAGSADLRGQMLAAGYAGDMKTASRGGSFNLFSNGAIALDPLADLLFAGGVTGAISVRTQTGNLQLSAGHTLRANTVTLTADDITWNTSVQNGQVIIGGVIEAGCTVTYCNGQTGGQVGLYGSNAVVLQSTASIVASTKQAGQVGGDVKLGIGWNAQGYIDLQSGAKMDVSGAGNGGTVYLRAPLVTGHAYQEGTVKILGLDATITGARKFSLEDYGTVSTESGVGLPNVSWNGVLDPANNSAFTNAIAQFVQGTLTGLDSAGNVVSYGFNGAVAQLTQSKIFADLQNPDLPNKAAVEFLPGVELVNTSTAVNSGNITIASNWNLAAGNAVRLQGSGKTQTYDPATSGVNFEYRYVANFGTQSLPQYRIEPGVLTLRAAGNINVNASISDGFFQFGNYNDPTYVGNVANYLKNQTSQRGIDTSSSIPNTTAYLYYLNGYAAVPVAPYDSTANISSPTSQQLAGADLFPHQLNVCVNCNGAIASSPPVKADADVKIVQVTNPGSWSYTMTAGAAARYTNGAVAISANPNAVVPLASIDAGHFPGSGDVVVAGHTSYTQQLYSAGNPNATTTVALPTMIRTGTGSIAVSAARDILLSDQTAPGVIYSAGVNTALPASPGYYLDGSGNVVAANPNGFLAPQVLAYDLNSNIRAVSNGYAAVYGPPTAAAFPTEGGDVTLVAQRDIIRVGNPTTSVTATNSGTKTVSDYQYFFPWLLADAAITPIGSANDAPNVSLLGAGVFAPFGTAIASQSAWWIQYGSFQQGILSAGGNVSVTAGRDLIDVSVSLPTTGYASGGLASVGSGVLNTPVMTVNGSGNMIVQAGRNILGGSFYEGSGTATIVAGGSVGPNGNLTTKTGTLQDLPVLAVDSGQITLTAGGSVSIGGVINPAELHSQTTSYANPANSSATTAPIFMDTYGPDSAVNVVAIAGNINIALSQTATISQKIAGQGSIFETNFPASFSAVALNGDITTNGLTGSKNNGIVLNGSPNGTFQLLAEGSIDLTGGVSPTLPSGALALPQSFPTLSAGPSLLDQAFDPYQPNNGATGASSQANLAQATNASTAKIYAVNGSITGAGQININRPTRVQAGLDIVDLNLTVENIAASDVSSVIAGRDIDYTGYHNLGGMQVAGPGFFLVEAGRNLGPFLPVNFDTAASATVQEGITSVGNASSIPVGNQWVQGSPGMYNPALLGPFSAAVKNRNPLLPTTGADIIALFGVGNKVNYQAVIDTYIDPANAANVAHNYIGELTSFLCTTGALTCSGGVPPAGTDVFAKFLSEPTALQHVFVDQVFTAELKGIGNTGSSLYQYYQGNSTLYNQTQKAALLDGYIMINTLFPTASGYTNNLGGSLKPVGDGLTTALGQANTSGKYAVNVLRLIQTVDLNGAAANFAKEVPPLVQTGDLNLLHATIQTGLGGNVSLLGPGGNVLVGSLAVEPNPNLKLNNLGILTLSGGDINTFTDGNVLVNTSRIFTEQGGDISMWSSNANLDAGRGAKTTASQPPLQVFFDADDYQIIDPAGLVTGAGIGVLQTTGNSTASNLYLLAPRGIINFGSAGVRASGNLVVVAPVISNADNAHVGGTAIGIPTVAAPNVGALTAASNTAGQQNKSTEPPTGSKSEGTASVFVVQVLSYGEGQDATGTGGDGNGKKDNQGNGAQ